MIIHFSKEEYKILSSKCITYEYEYEFLKLTFQIQLWGRANKSILGNDSIEIVTNSAEGEQNKFHSSHLWRNIRHIVNYFPKEETQLYEMRQTRDFETYTVVIHKNPLGWN